MSASLYCPHCGALNPAAKEKCFACDHSLTTAAPASVDLSGLQRTLRQRYRLLRQIGSGGFAAVYKAEDIQLGNRVVAVKEMSARGLTPAEKQEATESFHQEALLLARLSHPNLPRIYEQFEEDGRWYLVMDFIDGQTLEEYLKDRGGRLPIKEALQLAIQLTNVLGYLHARQPPIVFRDLKPGNVMLTPDGRVYLIDFGIARLFKPGQAKDTIAFGSPGYAAPEQYGKAQTTPRSDVFSLGALLHHMISGTDPSDTPFRFKPLTMPRPAGLSNLIDHMVDLDVARRPATMELVRTDLEQMLNSPAPWRTDDARVPTPNPYTTPLPATTRAFPSVAPPPPSWQVQNTGQFTQGGPMPPPVQKKNKKPWFIWVAAAIIGYLVLVNLFHSTPSTPYDGSPVDGFSVTTTPVSSVVGVYAVAWSPGGSELAFGGADSELDIIGTVNHVVALNLQEVNAIAWSPDGQYLAVSGGGNFIIIVSNSGNIIASYTVQPSQVNALAWSPTQSILAIGSNDGEVILADALTGGNSSTLHMDTDTVMTVAWSPDGQYLAFGGADNQVQVWDVNAKKAVYNYQDTPAINAVAWSSTGNHLAFVDAAGGVAVVDPLLNGSTPTFYANQGGAVSTSITWSNDNSYLAAGNDDDTVQVWQIGNTTPTYTYGKHNDIVRSVSWEPNSGTMIASASYDGTVQVWNALNGATEQTYNQP